MIRADPQLFEELALCDRWGIPHSHFLGGPRRWSPLDQDKAVAFTRVKGQVCGRCGTHPDDFDPAHGGHRDAWIGQSRTCEGCRRIHLEEKGVPESRQAFTKVWLAPELLAEEPDEAETMPRRQAEPERQLSQAGAY